jgi:hypothetical protein
LKIVLAGFELRVIGGGGLCLNLTYRTSAPNPVRRHSQ